MKTNKSIFYSVVILLLFTLSNCKKEIGPTEDIACSGQVINENHPKKNAIDAIISDYVKKLYNKNGYLKCLSVGHNLITRIYSFKTGYNLRKCCKR
jgi:hypothetical protein